MPKQAPCGSWQSPITADLLTSKSISIYDPKLVDDDVYWVEMRPGNEGRYALVRQTIGQRPRDLVSGQYSVRTKVHEYGGNPYAVLDGKVLFSNFADDCLYTWRSSGRRRIEQFLPPHQCRYADFAVNRSTGRVYAVREDHSVPNQECTNTLVMVDTEARGSVVVMAQGHDFYSSPVLNRDGTKLAWLAWNHPDMPWDETELWMTELDEFGEAIQPELVWAESGVSIFQPAWSPANELFCVADPDGWWNLYRMDTEAPTNVCPMEAEFGAPQWVFGLSKYAFIDRTHILCTWSGAAGGNLGILDLDTGDLETVDTPYSSFSSLSANERHGLFLAASPTHFPTLALLDLASGEVRELRTSNEVDVDPAYYSMPQAVEFETEGGVTAHAWYYPPANPEYEVPEGERPPLRVKSHGGPTSQTGNNLDLQIQYWTSRGFAVVDVNYGGSTGYGTAYRRRLNGTWGLVDVQDCGNAAAHLVEQGLADGQRLSISGGSAGGFTTLACLAFTDRFHVGISYFGVSDLGALARETHKFESRYLDSLVGKYPEESHIYEERSPLTGAEGITCPVLFLQGDEDKIVLPNQAEMMVDALRARGVPVAYLLFAGEQHGFRKAENIVRSLQAETSFLARFFGYEPAEELPDLDIDMGSSGG